MGTDEDDQLERRRDELRRIVYGQPGEPSPEAAAELAALEEELVASHGPDAAGPDDAGDDDAGDDDAGPYDAGAYDAGDDDGPVPPDGPVSPGEPPPEGTVPSPRRRRVAWVLGGTLAVLVVIAVAFAVLAPARDALSPPRGLGVFEREQTEEELDRANQVATGVGLESEEDVATLRSLGRAFGYDFWVWRNDERVCLLSQRQFFFEWVETCASIEVFGEYGLTRLLAADDIRDGARPRRIGPGDVVVITWGPDSTDVEWVVEP
jgi:hypothetical protein